MTESYEELHERLTKNSPFSTYAEVEAGLLKDIECRLVSSSEERARWKKVLTTIPKARASMAKTLLEKTELSSEEIVRACLAGTPTAVGSDDDPEADQASDRDNFDIGRHAGAIALGKLGICVGDVSQLELEQYELGRAAAKSVSG